MMYALLSVRVRAASKYSSSRSASAAARALGPTIGERGIPTRRRSLVASFPRRRAAYCRKSTTGRPSAVCPSPPLGYREAVKPQAWVVIALAALVGPVAWRFARRSKLALAIALIATTVAGLGLAFGALGYGGCAQRGDCGIVGGALRTVLIVAIMLLASLLLFALARVLWRGPVPRGAGSGRPPARGGAPRLRRPGIP